MFKTIGNKQIYLQEKKYFSRDILKPQIPTGLQIKSENTNKTMGINPA